MAKKFTIHLQGLGKHLSVLVNALVLTGKAVSLTYTPAGGGSNLTTDFGDVLTDDNGDALTV